MPYPFGLYIVLTYFDRFCPFFFLQMRSMIFSLSLILILLDIYGTITVVSFMSLLAIFISYHHFYE